MQQHAVKVSYACIDGAHFFVSTHGVGKGLCVANTDFYAAFNEVAEQLQILAKVNHQVDANFKPTVKPETLMAWARQQETVNEFPELEILASSDWRKHSDAA